MGKKRVGRHPRAFREKAVERMKGSANVTALAKELGIERCLLYKWQRQLTPIDQIGEPPPHVAEAELRRQVTQLKQSLADKTLEADFFRAALQKVAARRQGNSKTGETASTPKFGN